MMMRLTGMDITLCPVCRQGRMQVTQILAPQAAPAAPDSS
jgi:hypothetical protein